MYKVTPLEVKFCQSPRDAVRVLFSESTPPSPPQVAPNMGPRRHDKLNTEKDPAGDKQTMGHQASKIPFVSLMHHFLKQFGTNISVDQLTECYQLVLEYNP